MERLRRAQVLVFGALAGWVHVAEALARSGVGRLILVDHDTVSLSNLNPSAHCHPRDRWTAQG